jgi:hypothetical protein
MRKPDITKLKAWIRIVKPHLIRNKDTIAKKLIPIAGGGSTRIWPARNAKNDEKFGLRIYRGQVIGSDPHKIKVYVQINHEAKDNALKEIVKGSSRGSHTNIAEAIIDTTKTEEEKFADMIHQLENDHDVCKKK